MLPVVRAFEGKFLNKFGPQTQWRKIYFTTLGAAVIPSIVLAAFSRPKVKPLAEEKMWLGFLQASLVPGEQKKTGTWLFTRNPDVMVYDVYEIQ